MGGFEGSSQVRSDGVRLDLIRSTRHDTWASSDYATLQQFGILTVRDTVRWHIVEAHPGEYDWQTLDVLLDAAASTGTEVIWDLAHYGWPDGLDIWSEMFVEHFARFASAAVLRIAHRLGPAPWICPINEMSFWSWAGAEVGHFNPAVFHRGVELKRQLVRASLAAMRAIRAGCPLARFIHAEPLVHIAAETEAEREPAERYRTAQYQALDMLSGRLEPELGGAPQWLDILGVNYYPQNQWRHPGGTHLQRDDPELRPLWQMLEELHLRYARPIVLAETGAEGDQRASWLRHVCEHVSVARDRGVPVLGICLYPVLDYPGWSDSRLCPTGLLGVAGDDGHRPVCHSLASELEVHQGRF
jgi:hypothetical protein